MNVRNNVRVLKRQFLLLITAFLVIIALGLFILQLQFPESMGICLMIYVAACGVSLLYVTRDGFYPYDVTVIAFCSLLLYGVGYPLYEWLGVRYMRLEIPQPYVLLTVQLYLLAQGSFLVGILAADLTGLRPRMIDYRQHRSQLGRDVGMGLSLAMLCIGILMMIFEYGRLGYFAGLTHTQALDLPRQASFFNLPYMPFILTGTFLASFFFPERKRWSRFKIVLLVTLILGFVAFQFSLGNRKEVLNAALVFVSGFSLSRGIKLTKRVALLGALLLVVFAIVGALRWTFPRLIFSGDPPSQSSIVKSFDYKDLLDGVSEFAIPAQTLAFYLADETAPRYYGETYLWSISQVIPGSVLYLGARPSLGQRFRNEPDVVASFPGRVPGFGFSPVAEAYINFGVIGIPLVFIIFGFLLRLIQKALLRKVNIIKGFIVSILVMEMFALSRSEFSNWFAELFWTILIGLAVIALMELIVIGVRNSKLSSSQEG